MSWRGVVHTTFRFDTIEEARDLLGLNFGERGRREARLELTYNVAAFLAQSCGPDGEGSPEPQTGTVCS